MAEPSLKAILDGASRRGLTVTSFRITQQQAEAIRRCEQAEGHAEATRLVVTMLFGRTEKELPE